MNPLWWIDAPFWQKLYFFGMTGGFSFFIYVILELLEGWNTKLRRITRFMKDECRKELERTRKWWKTGVYP